MLIYHSYQIISSINHGKCTVQPWRSIVWMMSSNAIHGSGTRLRGNLIWIMQIYSRLNSNDNNMDGHRYRVYVIAGRLEFRTAINFTVQIRISRGGFANVSFRYPPCEIHIWIIEIQNEVTPIRIDTYLNCWFIYHDYKKTRPNKETPYTFEFSSSIVLWGGCMINHRIQRSYVFKRRWNFNPITGIFIQENNIQNFVCKMLAIFPVSVCYYNMTVWILARKEINFSMAAGLIRLHMPGVK